MFQGLSVATEPNWPPGPGIQFSQRERRLNDQALILWHSISSHEDAGKFVNISFIVCSCVSSASSN